MSPVLRAQGLSLTRNGVAILSQVDLALHRGQTVALLGPNGAGKSSLLAVLAGLLPADAGELHIDGRVAAALQAPSLAARSAQANVELALRWWGVARAERAARAQAALALVRAGDLADRGGRSLSGGEARRVHLARVLALQPEVLLLDEPFAGLDAATRAELLGDTAEVLRSPERATLIVVHDRAEAWAVADRVVVLMGGRVAADGPVAEVLRRPATPELADFLGFDGRLERAGGVIRLRAADVVLCSSGAAAATTEPGGAQDGQCAGVVRSRIPLEDGVRVLVEVAEGVLSVVAPNPGPAVGEQVRLSHTGGVFYPAAGSVRETPPPVGPTP